MRRFLLVVNKGPEPCDFKGWVLSDWDRTWDLHELLWHPESVSSAFADRSVRSAYINKDWRKFEAFKESSLPGWDAYDAICLADDDVWPFPGTWSAVFDAFMATGMHVGSPALTATSHIAHPIMERAHLTGWRETNYLDIMCVLFSREGLKDQWDTFSAPREPWGIESIWAQRELAAGRAIAILDSTPILHARPINTTPERVAQAMADHDALLKRFGVERITEHRTLKVHT